MFRRKLKIQNSRYSSQIKNNVDKVNEVQRESSAVKSMLSFTLKTFSLIFFGGMILFPFFYLISTALMSDAEATDKINGHLVPKDGYHWENFTRAFQDGYWKALSLTLIVTALSIVLKLLFTMTMGYGFSYNKWWGKNVIWYMLIALMMIPEIGLLVGQYRVVVDMHMHAGNQVIIAMFLPFIANIFSAFMFKNAFEAIPKRIKEAAMIDGASEFKYFWKVAVPMITPTMWTVVILTAFASWNSYMWPQLLTSMATDGEKKHVLGTWLFTTGKVQRGAGNVQLMMNVRLAAAILVMIPMIIVYAVFRKRIMRAISRQGSGIKG